jgi:glycosyltransferase involved in cell wall biosynthesis
MPAWDGPWGVMVCAVPDSCVQGRHDDALREVRSRLTPIAVWIAFGFVVLVLVELVRLSAILFRVLKDEPYLPEISPVDASTPLPLLSVIVPAKDEAACIEESVRSILRSDYGRLEVLLVDDRSRDGTLAIMEKLAAEDARVKTNSVRDLPDGWTGKTHAMFRATEGSSGEIVLFTDADASFDPHLLRRAVHYFQTEGLDMLSLLPGFVDKGFNETAVYPHMALGLSYFYPLPEVNDRAKQAGLASGCFIMMKKSVYDRVGTWQRFRNEVTEDVALSKAIKREGFNLRVLRAGNLVRTRAFGNVMDVCRFWKRTYYGALEKNMGKTARLASNYASLCVVTALFLISGLVLLSGRGGTPDAALFVASCLALAAVIIPFSLFIRSEGGNWLYGLASPVGVFLGLCVAVSTLLALLSKEGIHWRGSRYT